MNYTAVAVEGHAAALGPDIAFAISPFSVLFGRLELPFCFFFFLFFLPPIRVSSSAYSGIILRNVPLANDSIIAVE